MPSRGNKNSPCHANLSLTTDGASLRLLHGAWPFQGLTVRARLWLRHSGRRVLAAPTTHLHCVLQRSRHEAPTDGASLRLLHGAWPSRGLTVRARLWLRHSGRRVLAAQVHERSFEAYMNTAGWRLQQAVVAFFLCGMWSLGAFGLSPSLATPFSCGPRQQHHSLGIHESSGCTEPVTIDP